MATIDAGTAKLAGLQIDMLQKIRNGQITISHLEWFNNLSSLQRDMLSGADLTKLGDPRFEYLKTIEVTVPEGYDHDTRLTTFGTPERRKEFYYYHEGLTDANFAEKATSKLIGGRKFAVKIFGIKKDQVVTSEDCLAQIKRVNGILTGAQGASLVYEQKKAELPKGKYYVSFDEKEALPVLGGYHGVPCVDANSDGAFEFNLGYFEHDWLDDRCLLCFCDLPAGEA
jgi:hypothetical protein